MSATDDETRAPALPWWRTLGAILLGLLGAVTLVGGLTWLLLYLHGPAVGTDVLVGVVLAAGGLVLLMPHRIPLRPARTAVVAGASALAGTAAGLVVLSTQLGGTFAYVMARGYPFHWVQRGAVAEDPDVARRIAESADWTVDLPALAGDLLFWAYVGMLLVVSADLARRARRDRVGARP
jgi:hypothetical protein